VRGAGSVSAAQLRASLDALTMDALRPVSVTLIGLYAFYAIVYALQLDQPGARTGLVMSAATALAFAASWLWARQRIVPVRWAGPIGAGFALLVGGNCLVSEAVTHNPQLSANLMLCLVATPLLLLDLPWLVAVSLLLATGWFIVQAVALPGTAWHVQAYPLVSSLVVAALVYAVRSRSHRRLEEAREALRVAASVDSLTGLLNRRGFLEAGEALLVETMNADDGAVLLFVDVDGLKAVNDGLGHHAGDELLSVVAGVLRDTFRDGDVVGRLGGDEFAVLLREPAAVLAPVDRLLAAVGQCPRAPSGARVSLSVGLAAAGPGESLEQLLRRGDADMYHSRRRRRTAAPTT
jgi:diguanylate cyclase (GGDEF)-like protein